MAWNTQEIGAREQPGVGTAVGSETWKANFADAEKAGVGGHHEARTAVEERVAGRWENLVGKCYGVGGGGEGRKAYLVASDPSRVKEVGGG